MSGARADDRARLRRAWLRGTLGALVLVALTAWVAGGLVAARYEARLGRMAREAWAERERLRSAVRALEEQAAFLRGAADLLREPASRVIAVRGRGPSPQATGRLLWAPGRGGYLLVAGLRPLPSGRAYAAWLTGGGPPRAAGTLVVDAAGRGALRIAAPVGGGAVEGILVTIEPAAGAAAPTGPVVLAPA